MPAIDCALLGWIRGERKFGTFMGTLVMSARSIAILPTARAASALRSRRVVVATVSISAEN
jgi:hypothetical protein